MYDLVSIKFDAVYNVHCTLLYVTTNAFTESCFLLIETEHFSSVSEFVSAQRIIFNWSSFNHMIQTVNNACFKD